MADDTEDKEYTWESAYERTWETLKEDESGSLKTSVLDAMHKEKRKLLLNREKNVRLGIMRHLIIILDMSEAQNIEDLSPTRFYCSLKLLDGFLNDFMDQNPISQLGIIATKDKRAETLSYLTGNVRKHKEVLADLKDKMCVGEPSLQNSLELALQSLKFQPNYTSREVLIIFGSLSTCDPTSITVTMELLKKHRVKCSVIGLAAEVYLCKHLSMETQGTYSVVLDEHHFKDILSFHTLPHPVTKDAEANLVKMGFPDHKNTADEPSICVCHGQEFTSNGYFCPQCESKYCSIPVECQVCRLTLVSGPQLARSYQHLFPLEAFCEKDVKGAGQHCFACLGRLEVKAYECETCKNLFCIDCDLIVHESLQCCPACSS